MTKFILIRHGQTEWNKQGIYTGQSDIPLNDTGRNQAKTVAIGIQPIKPDRIFTSDLIRAVETARAIQNKAGVPLIKDKRLREIHQGEWEGLHVDEIKRRFTDKFMQRKGDPLNVAPPGGETIGQVYQRVSDFLYEIITKYPQDKIVIVAHAIVLAIINIISEHLPIDHVFDYIPKNAKIHQLEIQEIQ